MCDYFVAQRQLSSPPPGLHSGMDVLVGVFVYVCMLGMRFCQSRYDEDPCVLIGRNNSVLGVLF